MWFISYALKNAKKKEKKYKKNCEIKKQSHSIEPSDYKSSYQLSIALPTELQFDVYTLKIAIYKLKIEWFWPLLRVTVARWQHRRRSCSQKCQK